MCVLVLGLHVSAVAEELVPGTYTPVTDASGTVWTVKQNGILGKGADGLITGGMVLMVNNVQFYTAKPMMSVDTGALVLENTQVSIPVDVTRRVRVQSKEGFVRFLDTFSNPSAFPTVLQIELRSNLGGRFTGVYTDRGRKVAGALEKRETGVIAIPKNAGQKAVLITASTSRATLKPTIGIQNDFQLSLLYKLEIPAGGEVSLLHAVSAIATPADTKSKTLAPIFRKTALSRIVRFLPREARTGMVNVRPKSGGTAVAGSLLDVPLDALGVEPGKQDILAVGDRTRLFGKASCAGFAVSTAHGRAEIPFDQVAALVGSKDGRLGRAILRDGQVLVGTLEAEDLGFTLPSGTQIAVDVRRLDRLVCRATEIDGAWTSETKILAELSDGTRIALTEAVPFMVATRWGALNIVGSELFWVVPDEERAVGRRVTLSDGSTFYGYLSGSTVVVPAVLFDQNDGVRISPSDVRALITKSGRGHIQKSVNADSHRSSDKETRLPPRRVTLAGRQVFSASLASESLDVITGGDLIQIPPSTIRSLKNVTEDYDEAEAEAIFELSLWGGSTVVGSLRSSTVSIRVRSHEWRVPTSDLFEAFAPAPQVSDASRTRIAALIRQLASDVWREREAATAELAEFGYLAQPVLEEIRNTTQDPEVRRRVDGILADLP